ncbi:MAG: SAM-dependent chlorinase/fluorinase [Treponema sp.]|jgi:S-adenosylmethionine hydrolase|nr:SAM-dependent chlorinase/fluorinase [Treponema sp.]
MQKRKPILVFQTDFTYKEGAVSSMYGVVKTVDPDLEIIDGTHEIPRYDIWSASYRLYQTVRFWPEGTIFVSVVDPGVGTARKACAVRTGSGYTIVTPDNGTLTHIYNSLGIEEIREIDQTVNRLKGKDTEGTSVFHGRDIFGYCAAKLASGIICFEEVGPSYSADKIVRLPLQEALLKDGVITGIFEIGDPNFGNLWTNIPLSLFEKAGFKYGDIINVNVTHNEQTVMDKEIKFEKSFGYVKPSELVIYTNELMYISLAVCMGSAIEEYGLGYGSGWKVKFTR